MFIQKSDEKDYGEGRSGVKSIWRDIGSGVVLFAEDTSRIGLLLREKRAKRARFQITGDACRRQMCLKRGAFIVLISPGERICRMRKNVLRARRLAMQSRQRRADVKRNFE
ncbi:hypothetical protein [Gimesia algae]|uniref:Uncharacterized protein n=1 Tax=Gimesia algae TaxID=2527971 RepID=A0A517V872_9PLAN|nr:hypothetical protein [Gimesia algae]QDT89205.1 hypothetical protein Pan161_08320 [Gimesia algae]